MSSAASVADHPSTSAGRPALESTRSRRRLLLALAGLLGAGLAGVLFAVPALAASTLSPAAVVHHEQNDPRFAYSGTWTTASAASASGGSFAFTDSSGSSMTIHFMGTHLSWIAKKSPAYGKARVTLDGKTLGTIDLYSATTEWRQKVWGTGTLKSGSHTVTIAWTGLKEAAAESTDINVDAFDVDGVVTGLYQQSDAKVVYAGTWKIVSTGSASGGSLALADASGASATVHFTGTDLVWIAKTSPAYGEAKVVVDGGSPVTVDLYSASVLWQQKVWSTGVLADGAHTVKIEWTGTKRAGATAANINLDALEVTGTLD
jgi:hypothetical protein